MKAAIIGLGNIGSRVAANLATRNQNVIIFERNVSKAVEFARKLGGKAAAMSIDDAIKAADIIVLAMWFDVIHCNLHQGRTSWTMSSLSAGDAFRSSRSRSSKASIRRAIRSSMFVDDR